MRPNNPILLSAVSNSGTKNSVAIDASYIISGSIQANFSDSAAAGTLTLQGSNDPSAGLSTDANGNLIPVHWDTVKNGSISATATVSAGALTTISMQWLNYRWLRVEWTQSSGAGTITVNGFFQAMS